MRAPMTAADGKAPKTLPVRLWSRRNRLYSLCVACGVQLRVMWGVAEAVQRNISRHLVPPSCETGPSAHVWRTLQVAICRRKWCRRVRRCVECVC